MKENAQKETENWTDVAMETVDKHLQMIRLLPWAMGGMGLILLARYSGAFTGYRRISQLPTNLIKLRGVAVGVWPDGRLDVWHTPLGRRLLHWNHLPPADHYPVDQVLSIRPALLKLSLPEESCDWMTSNLVGRPLHLHIIDRYDDELHCIIYYREGYMHRMKCVNVKLISLGLASLQEPSPDCHGNIYQRDEKLMEFLREGVKEEGVAQRRGRGVWRGTVHERWWRKLIRKFRLK